MTLKNVVRGAGWGAVSGALFAVIALLVVATAGSEYIRSTSDGIRLGLLYVLGFSMAGIITALVRPSVTTRGKAVAIGPVVLLPMGMISMHWLAGSISQWAPADWAGLLIGDLLLGVMAGWQLWEVGIFAPPTGTR